MDDGWRWERSEERSLLYPPGKTGCDHAAWAGRRWWAYGPSAGGRWDTNLTQGTAPTRELAEVAAVAALRSHGIEVPRYVDPEYVDPELAGANIAGDYRAAALICRAEGLPLDDVHTIAERIRSERIRLGWMTDHAATCRTLGLVAP